ncbi:glutamate racemase [Paenibacillus thermoaerophilus]|uniref:Glutamate racemase n=1 Tax=Paenibacillus thermoaerophilus TaxID=1215385 RepID=A0ABW2V901_9BACL|nr:glutamate racemase [Paenibacillus thermoaerophilus]TMV17919.1 glutamate racemase [Paenibacillus thermoaerophilus]
MKQAIAILDSGVGGLTVVREVMRQLPREEIIYFGDTARAPYGPRDPQEVRQFTREIVAYLMQYDPKMIVIACNTATAVALDDIRAMVDVPVVGVIHPGARAAIKITRSNRIGVIGTVGTIRSDAYRIALESISPMVEVYSLACPDFVPLVEQGLYRSEEALHVVERSLEPLRGLPLDCLILGCTHYPFLADSISQVMGNDVRLISSAEETAREISTILYQTGRLERTVELPVHRFFCSGQPVTFQTIARQWLGNQIEVCPVVWQVPQIS